MVSVPPELILVVLGAALVYAAGDATVHGVKKVGHAAKAAGKHIKRGVGKLVHRG